MTTINTGDTVSFSDSEGAQLGHVIAVIKSGNLRIQYYASDLTTYRQQRHVTVWRKR